MTLDEAKAEGFTRQVFLRIVDGRVCYRLETDKARAEPERPALMDRLGVVAAYDNHDGSYFCLPVKPIWNPAD